MRYQVRNKIKGGAILEVGTKKIPMVDLPLGATEDRVCGTIDIEKALTEGEWVWCAWPTRNAMHVRLCTAAVRGTSSTQSDVHVGCVTQTVDVWVMRCMEWCGF